MGNHTQSTFRTFDGKIDDVRFYDRALSTSAISDLFTSTGGGSGSGPSNCNGTYRDNFDSLNFDGSNGSLDWSATSWTEVGESDGATSSDVQVRTDTSNYQLRIRHNNNGGEGVEREADLSGSNSAILTLDHRRQGLDNSSDHVAVYASSNGIVGPYTELPAPRIEGSATDGNYQSYSRDISAYISANTAIRLRSSSSMGNNDIVYFYNIEVQCSP